MNPPNVIPNEAKRREGSLMRQLRPERNRHGEGSVMNNPDVILDQSLRKEGPPIPPQKVILNEARRNEESLMRCAL